MPHGLGTDVRQAGGGESVNASAQWHYGSDTTLNRSGRGVQEDKARVGDVSK